jgi:hypothetical protein
VTKEKQNARKVLVAISTGGDEKRSKMEAGLGKRVEPGFHSL